MLQLNEELDVSLPFTTSLRGLTVPETTTTFNAFLAEQEKGGADAVRLLDPLRLRYFSPSELLRLFCFELPRDDGSETFVWPDAISSKTEYELIGNSVNVEVVRRLIEYLFA